MGKLVWSVFTTLDGRISGPRDELDWLPESEDTSLDSIEVLATASAVLLGRRTYSIFEDYWPAASSASSTYPPDLPLAHRLNALPKYVFSSTLTHIHWNTTIVAEPALPAIARLKKQLSGDLVIFGSGVLARSLIDADLIDEYRLTVLPLVLGAGARLFGARGPRADLELVGTKVLKPGFVSLHYRAGEHRS